MVFQNQPFKAVDLAERRKGLLAGLRAAVKELKRPGHVKPQWDQLVLVGHSVGGNMAAQLAADTGKQRLPRPKAVFAVQPRPEDEASIRVLRGIAPSSLVLVLASDRDDRVGVEGPKALWAALGHIPATNKDYVLVRSDEHGAPARRAPEWGRIGRRVRGMAFLKGEGIHLLDNPPASTPVGTVTRRPTPPATGKEHSRRRLLESDVRNCPCSTAGVFIGAYV